MMKTMSAVCGLLLLFVADLSAQEPSQAVRDQAEIRKLADDVFVAAHTADTTTMKRLLAAQYRRVERGGKLVRRLDRIRATAAATPQRDYDPPGAAHVRVYQNVAVAAGRTPDGNTWTQIWEKTPAGWKLFYEEPMKYQRRRR